MHPETRIFELLFFVLCPSSSISFSFSPASEDFNLKVFQREREREPLGVLDLYNAAWQSAGKGGKDEEKDQRPKLEKKEILQPPLGFNEWSV